MPLVKPTQLPRREAGAWEDVGWPSERQALTADSSAYDRLTDEYLGRLQLQRTKAASEPTFRVLLKESRTLLATGDEEQIVKDCLELGTVVGMLATEIELGQMDIRDGEEEEELATFFRQYWDNNKLKPVDAEIDDFEELIPTEAEPAPTFLPLNDSARRRVQKGLRRSKEQRKKRVYKWKHVSKNADDIELALQNAMQAGEKELGTILVNQSRTPDTGEGQEMVLMKDGKPVATPERSQSDLEQDATAPPAEKDMPAQPKEQKKEGTTKEDSNQSKGERKTGKVQDEREKEKDVQESGGGDEWLWMEVASKEVREDEFWDVKEHPSSYEPPAVAVDEDTEFVNLNTFVSEEFELSSDTSWQHRNKHGFRDERRYMDMKSSFFSPNEARAASVWNTSTIPNSRQAFDSRLKELVRNGIPDSKRGKVWLAVAGCNEFYAVYPNYYADVIDRVYGSRIPKSFYQVPLFGGELKPGDHYLTTEGIQCAQRVLWALAMENPDIDYVPVLPDAVCIALSFLTEADAYTLINLMLDQSREDRWFFSLSNRQSTLFLLTFQSLLTKYLPRLAAHLESIGIDLALEFADPWFKRLFVNSLPYQTVLRVWDVYISEGSAVLYRVALAILRVASTSLMGCRSRVQFNNTLQQICIQYQDADHLLRTAFRITSLSRKEMASHDEVNSAMLKSVREPAYKPFYRPRITDESIIIEEIHFEALWSLLPSCYSIMDPVLIFSTKNHGFSLKSLLERCDTPAAKPCFLLIKDRNKRVFGAFASQGLIPRDSHYGTTDCFLFLLVPEVKKYGWLAGQKRLFARINTKGIFFGDGRGLVVDDELWHGSSQTSETFANEPLAGDKTEFECVALEVFGFRAAAS